MHGDSPQYACLRLTPMQYSVLYEFVLLKKHKHEGPEEAL